MCQRPTPVPLTEDAELEATNIYGVTKVCSEMCGRAYARRYGCHIVFTRSFNHTGPGQSDAFVVSAFARQCAEIALGKRDPLVRVGNLELRRSFLDVRDVVRAYRLLVESGQPGEVYNVCAEQPNSLRDLLTILISFTGRNDIRVEVDSARVRANEPEVVQGDCRRLRERTGWSPQVEIRETLRGVYDYWLGASANRVAPA